jgi:hypothetical protein
MRQPPTYTTWKITCRSAEDAEALQQWLFSRIDLNRVVADTIRTSPGGTETSRTESYRLGDYFTEISMVSAGISTSLRLVFHLRPDAGRFWKDLMVNILQEVETAPQAPKVELESKGERNPGAAAAAI